MNKTHETQGIKAFFMSLLPNFEKGRVQEALSAAFKEAQITREMYGIDSSAYSQSFRKRYPELDGMLREKVSAYKGDLIRLVRETLDARLKEEHDFAKHVDEIYGPVVVKDALDYQKLYTLRYIDGWLFFNTYARKLLLMIVNDELENPDVVSPIDRADREWLLMPDHIRAFAIMLNALQVGAKDFRQLLTKLKNIQFSLDMHDVTIRQSRDMDPMQSNLMPVVGGITFAIGRVWNLYAARRLEEAQHQKEKLQVQLLLLRRKLDSTTDERERAKLKTQIGYYNDLLNKVSAKIEDLSEV